MRRLLGARGLPAEAYASWQMSLAARGGASARILSWARTEDGYVLGSPAVLSVGGVRDAPGRLALDCDSEGGDSLDASGRDAPGRDGRNGDGRDDGRRDDEIRDQADRGDDREGHAGSPGWAHLGWHEIEHGGWNAESRTLSWTLYGGRRGRVALADAARLPELFRERVAASIVVERFVPIRGERGVTVTARRDLGGAGSTSWHSSLTRGLTWSTEGVAEEAARAVAELQSEYGSGPSGW